MLKNIRCFCILFLLLLFIGCQQSNSFKNPAPTDGDPAWADKIQAASLISPDELDGRILDLKKNEFIDFETLIKRMPKTGVVYVGETHDNPLHHEIQNKVLRALYEDNRKVAVGMEMFHRPFQKHLDDYTAGKISEMEMLEKTEYPRRWGFDWSMYRPMVTFARENKLKVVGLNALKEISSKVARQGLKALTAEERASLPETIDTSDADHRAFVWERFKGHMSNPMVPFTEKDFPTFYESQCVWEDTMADSIDRYFKAMKKPAGRMVIIVGSGHVLYRFGIPKRANRRTGLPYQSIVCMDTQTGRLDELLKNSKNIPYPADFFWFTRREKFQRVVIGFRVGMPIPGQKGILIDKLAPNTPASKTDLKNGDLIIGVNARPIQNLNNLKEALKNKKAGEVVELTVLREGKEHKIKVELTSSP